MTCASTFQGKNNLLEWQAGRRTMKGIEALLAPLDTELRPPFADNIFRTTVNEIKLAALKQIAQAMIHQHDRAIDVLRTRFKSMRGVEDIQSQLEPALTKAERSIKRPNKDTIPQTRSLIDQLAKALDSNRVETHHPSGLHATTSGLDPVRTSEQTEESRPGTTSPATANVAPERTIFQTESVHGKTTGTAERTELGAYSDTASTIDTPPATAAAERTESQPPESKRRRYITTKTDQAPDQNPLSLKEEAQHMSIPLPPMATVQGGMRAITAEPHDPTKFIPAGEAYKVLSSMNLLGDRQQRPDFTPQSRAPLFSPTTGIRTLGGATDVLALEHPNPLVHEGCTYATGRHAIEWEKCSLALGMKAQDINALFRDTPDSTQLMTAVADLMVPLAPARTYWRSNRYGTKLRWLTRMALTQGPVLGELLHPDYKGFTSNPKAGKGPYSASGRDLYAVMLWQLRCTLQHFASFVSTMWDLYEDTETALSRYEGKDSIIGREITNRIRTLETNGVLSHDIYSLCSVDPATEFEWSGPEEPTSSLPPQVLAKPQRSPKKARRQRAEQQRNEKLGASSQSDTSDKEENSQLANTPDRGTALDTSKAKVTKATTETASTYRQHKERMQPSKTSNKASPATTSSSSSTTPATGSKRLTSSLAKTAPTPGGSAYEPGSERAKRLIDGQIEPCLMRSRPVGRVTSYKESTASSSSPSSSTDSTEEETDKAKNDSDQVTFEGAMAILSSPKEDPPTTRATASELKQGATERTEFSTREKSSTYTSTKTPTKQPAAERTELSTREKSSTCTSTKTPTKQSAPERTDFQTASQLPSSGKIPSQPTAERTEFQLTLDDMGSSIELPQSNRSSPIPWSSGLEDFEVDNILETPPELQGKDRSQETNTATVHPDSPPKMFPQIVTLMKEIKPHWTKGPARHIPAATGPICDPSEVSTTSATREEGQEETAPVLPPPSENKATCYQPSTWSKACPYPPSVTPDTVNFVIGDETVGHFRNFYTPAGHTVLHACPNFKTKDLVKLLSREQMIMPQVKNAFILLPGRDLEHHTVESTTDIPRDGNSSFRIDGQWGPTTRAIRQMITASLTAFPNASIHYFLPELHPQTTGTDGKPLVHNIVGEYRSRFQAILGNKEEAKGRITNIQTPTLQSDLFHGQEPFNINKRGATVLAQHVKTLLAAYIVAKAFTSSPELSGASTQEHPPAEN